MKLKLILFFAMNILLGYSQEIRRISKAQEDIKDKNKTYLNAIASSGNSINKEIAFVKDTSQFLAELEEFLAKLDKELRNDNGSLNFIKEHKVMTYILYVSNTGYIDAFYYDFDDGKLKLPFMGVLNSFIANYQWKNSSRVKFVHGSVYTFK
jgi:hypothetical protein